MSVMVMSPVAVRERMLELEQVEGAPARVAARALGVDCSEQFRRTLMSEVNRALGLCADFGRMPNAQTVTVAVLQGIMFAAAVLELADGE